MKRFFRIFSRALILLSFLLFFLSIIFWIRSYWSADGITYSRNGYDADGLLIRRYTALTSSKGHIQISSGQLLSILFRSISSRYQEGFQFSHDTPHDVALRSSSIKGWSHLGLIYGRTENPMFTSKGLAIPYWLLSLLLLLPPSLWLLRWCMGDNFASHQCLSCGYDMRATPERCPECGASRSPPASRPSLPSLLARKAALEKKQVEHC